MEKEILLPELRVEGKYSLQKAIRERRSVRDFSSKKLTLEQIGQLCWAAAGVTDKAPGFRSAPSAGAIYPLEIYVANEKGLLRYLPISHGLKIISGDDLRDELAKAAYGQDFVAQAPADLIVTCVFARIISRYGKRGIQYAFVETGHVAQNVHLTAVSLGLGSVPVGAFDDEAVKKVLSLPKGEEPLYIIPVGYPK